MAYPLDKAQFDTIVNLSASERYDHFVAKAAETEEIWSLKGEGGWVSLSSDGEDCFPVWPHPDFAAAWATGDWADCRPQVIRLDAWIDRWTPGLEGDGSLVAVFPRDEEEGVVATPGELLQSLLAELEAFQGAEPGDND